MTKIEFIFVFHSIHFENLWYLFVVGAEEKRKENWKFDNVVKKICFDFSSPFVVLRKL